MAAEFHFLRPGWLWALPLVALLVWRLVRDRAGGAAWRDLVDAHLLPHLLVPTGAGSRGPALLVGLGGLLGILALAGPVWERLPQPVFQAGAHRVILLDLSPTMNAPDVPPSRLAQARFKLLDLLKRLREGQTALLAFGAEPYLVAPLTSDVETIAAQVPHLETALLPVSGGRRLDLALRQAELLLHQAGASGGEIILITDGLDQAATAQETARALRASGLRLSVLGIGTGQGAPVPLGKEGFLKDSQGAILVPRLPVDALEQLANAGGGRYVGAGADDRDLDALVPAAASTTQGPALAQDTQADQWREEGPWLLLLLLPLAALAFRRGWWGPLVLLLGLVPPPDAQALEWADWWGRPDQQAAEALAAGQAAQAAERFERLDWRAAANYQAGDYAKALQALEGLSGAEADYNRGNSLAKLGRLEEALAAYDGALKENSEHGDARHNRDLVQRLLEQQKNQQDQQNQQEQKGPQDQPGQRNQHDPQSQQDQQNQQAQQGQQDQQGQQGQQDQPGQAGGEGRQDQENPAGQGDQNRQAEGADPEQDQDSQAASAGQGHQEPTQESSQTAPDPDSTAGQPAASPKQGPEPSQADLLGNQDPPGSGPPPSVVPDQASEQRQALDAMLRRVPDDPGGLLRQRFMLQHLRRSGRLP